MIKKLFTLCLLVVTYIDVRAQNVVQAEYFFDNGDVGYGLCNQLTLAASADSMWQLPNISVAGLTAGGHRIYIRTLDDNQQWSHTIRRYFEIPTSQSTDSVVVGEWFVDDGDLGFGNCIPFNISSPDTNILEALNLDIAANYPTLSYGNHKVYVRRRDTNNKWSHTMRRTFEVTPPDDSLLVVEVEFFDDVDAGFGNCQRFAIPTPFTDGCWTIQAPYPYANWQSNDTLFVRVRDSVNARWSHTIRVNKLGASTCYVGISEPNAETQFAVYPNPASYVITIALKNETNAIVSYQLYNMIGELLKEEKITALKTKIQLSYTPGIYFIKVNSGTGTTTQKIIIQ